MNVTAVCERSGDWWAVTIPEVEGGFTQAKRLDQVPAMVADLVELATGTPRTQVNVDVRATVPGTDAGREWAEASRLEYAARALQDAAAACKRVAVSHYKDAGLSVRDIGELTGISFQRVSQVLATPKIGGGSSEPRAKGVIRGLVDAVNEVLAEAEVRSQSTPTPPRTSVPHAKVRRTRVDH